MRNHLLLIVFITVISPLCIFGEGALYVKNDSTSRDGKVDWSSQYSLRIKPENRKKSLGLETDLSYVLYFKPNILSGVGISLTSEFKRSKIFSVLLGVAVQYVPTNGYNYGLPSEPGSNIQIDKGYRIRFGPKIAFRWTYDTKVPVFIQYRWSLGADFYQGWGNENIHGGVGRNFTTYGWQNLTIAYMDLISLAVGIRKELKPGIEIVIYIEGTPVSLQFTDYPFTYSPFAQFHLGFNFNKKHKDLPKK